MLKFSDLSDGGGGGGAWVGGDRVVMPDHQTLLDYWMVVEKDVKKIFNHLLTAHRV